MMTYVVANVDEDAHEFGLYAFCGPNSEGKYVLIGSPRSLCRRRRALLPHS
jgi:hypothetical protein